MLNPLAALAVLMGDPNVCGSRDHNYLQMQGWIPLGPRTREGGFYWTTLERGLAGAVTTEEALKIDRTRWGANTKTGGVDSGAAGAT